MVEPCRSGGRLLAEFFGLSGREVSSVVNLRRGARVRHKACFVIACITLEVRREELTKSAA